MLVCKASEVLDARLPLQHAIDTGPTLVSRRIFTLITRPVWILGVKPGLLLVLPLEDVVLVVLVHGAVLELVIPAADEAIAQKHLPQLSPLHLAPGRPRQLGIQGEDGGRRVWRRE